MHNLFIYLLFLSDSQVIIYLSKSSLLLHLFKKKNHFWFFEFHNHSKNCEMYFLLWHTSFLFSSPRWPQESSLCFIPKKKQQKWKWSLYLFLTNQGRKPPILVLVIHLFTISFFISLIRILYLTYAFKFMNSNNLFSM